MRYQTILVTVCLITHITNIRALTTMNVLMSYHMAPFTECLITNFTALQAILNYVCVYVSSDYSCHCMPYYTHHKHKGAHHYVCVDVLSDCSVY